MELKIIDTHAHLDMPEFDTDREDVINRAIAAGVKTMITIGINVKSCLQAVALAEKHPSIRAAIGIHPQDAKGIRREDIDQLEALAGNPRVVAIGELGLDYHWDRAPREDQIRVLMWELELAQKVKLPISIHCRDAQEDMIPVLREWCDAYKLPGDKARGVLHCFSADNKTAEKYMDMGFFVALGAYTGYPSSARLRETLKTLPLDRMVIETDCPFLPPQKYRGKRNEPAYTVFTAGVLAEIKGISPEEIARQTTLNAIRLFNLPEAIPS